MTSISPEQFQELLPLACEWAEQQEQHILKHGIGLAADQIVDAMLVGVADPARVRLLRVVQIPVPEHPMLRAAAEATSLISPLTTGLNLRHGLFIRSDCWGRRLLNPNMNPDTNVPAFVQHESPREFFRRMCLMGNQRPPSRHRVLAHRLRKLGFEVRRIMRRSNPPDQWEVYLGITYYGLPPAVDMLRECLRRALSALGYRCPRGKIRVRLTGFRLKMTFPWPPVQRA